MNFLYFKIFPLSITFSINLTPFCCFKFLSYTVQKYLTSHIYREFTATYPPVVEARNSAVANYRRWHSIFCDETNGPHWDFFCVAHLKWKSHSTWERYEWNGRIISLLFPSNLIFAFAFFSLFWYGFKAPPRTHSWDFYGEFFSSRVTIQFSRNETKFSRICWRKKRENDAKKNIIKSISNHFLHVLNWCREKNFRLFSLRT